MDPKTFQTRYGTTVQEVHAKLVTRAWKDETFRNRLVGEPRAAIREEAGIELPADFDVRVVEVTPSYLPVVIPQPSPDQKAGSVDDIVVLLTSGIADQPEEVRETVRNQARLLAKTWTDTGFRAELEDRPVLVLERELGVQIPDDVRVDVLSESPSQGYLVLPPNPNVDTDELSDEQLESVAGGVSPTVGMLVSLTLVGTMMALSYGAATAITALNSWDVGDMGMGW